MKTSKMAYEASHPWITFRLRLDKASSDFWILAGEAKSKCEQIASAPLPPVLQERLHLVYLVKGALATVAIEGNTLSEKQVHQRLEGNLPLPPSQEYLGTEIDNVMSAFNQIGIQLQGGNPPILSVKLIKAYNLLVLRNLKVGEGVIPGEIRKEPFGVGHYRGAPPEECEYLLKRLCEWLNSPDFQPPDDGEDKTLITAFIKAVLAHLYLEWIHPFGDGNGRTGRLLEFLILVSSGVPSPAAHLLSNHYNLTRAEYYHQLELSSRTGGDVLPFLIYALKGFVDGLRTQVKNIRTHQWNLAWHSFVQERFRDRTSPSDKRRLQLVQDLSNQKKPVPLNILAEITTHTTRAYATKTPRTLTRDLNHLKKMGLIEFSKEGYRAMKEIILEFLPLRIDPLVKEEQTVGKKSS